MKNLKQTLTKGAFGTVAAGAMALGTLGATATPAMAGDRYDRDRGVDAGDVIAGAVIIGGIAAVLGAFDNDDRYDRRDRRYRDSRYGYDRYDGRRMGRRAIERCIRVAERQAQRFGGYRYANVTQIRDVDRTRYGLRVKGRIEVEGLRGYGRGYGNRGYDQGRFTCYADGRGRPQVEFRGIRGLR